MNWKTTCCMVLLAGCAWGALSVAADEPPAIVITASRVHTMTGPALANGVLVIRGGAITAVGPKVSAPAGSKKRVYPDAVVTPGLIDANCWVDFGIPQNSLGGAWVADAPPNSTVKPAAPALSLWADVAEHVEHAEPHLPGHDHGADETCSPACSGAAVVASLFSIGASPRASWAEQSAEVVPHSQVSDSLNLLSKDFERLLAGGVTTVFVAPDSASVIGARGAIVRTAGPLEERYVQRAAAVKATIGRDPIGRGRNNRLPQGFGPDTTTMFMRRPMTRMGVEWVFRKAFHDALAARAGRTPRGADTPPAEALPVLAEILDGRVPLRIQARTQKDILNALRLAREFNLQFTLEEATEAYACAAELKAAGVPVIFGPLYLEARGARVFSGEVDEPRLSTPRRLLDAGVPLALSAQEFRDEEGLIRQAMYAHKYGLSAEEALRSVTVDAARLLGLPEGSGTLASGAPADLVVWSGDPLDPTTRVEAIFIGGRQVFARGRVDSGAEE